jgi:hypothetical protein
MSFFETNAADDVTLLGLEKWTCYMYEQLGWMTLAYQSKREDKVGSYLISINKLQKSIEARLKIITSEDAKLDLTSLLSKVKHLLKITSTLFNKEHIKKTICDKCSLPVEVNNQLLGGLKYKIKSKNLKKLSKIQSKKILKEEPKKQSKKLSKILSKKLLKEQQRKQSKKQSKKNIKKSNENKNDIFEPLIKKLSKKSSKKNSK